MLVAYSTAISFDIEYRDPYCFNFVVETNTDIDVFYHITGSNSDRVTIQVTRGIIASCLIIRRER